MRRVRDRTVAWRGTATRWNGGAVHAQSGDRCWSVDFSDLRESGSFFLIDPTRGVRSEDFAIGDGVYRDVLRAAVRMHFYQRCGAAKATPHAHPNWADGPCHLGAGQDRDCRPVLAPTSNGRDLSGGWHDAGDYNNASTTPTARCTSCCTPMRSAPMLGRTMRGSRSRATACRICSTRSATSSSSC
ncbi:MAG: glycoside hydrolase family 9 protein [Planctomycetes bacterium]|nr:glycoside hydrolase family 9 protein [Planctomycetota bacterium]